MNVTTRAEVVADPTESSDPITADPDNDYLVHLAEGVGVDALISGDPRLTELDRPGLTVLIPRMALIALKSG